MTVQPLTTSGLIADAANVRLDIWNTLANGDTGTPLRIPDYPNRSVAVSGTFGVSGSVSLEGSMDNINWFVLKDLNGNAITLTAAGLVKVGGNALYVRPHATAGDGTTALVAQLLSNRDFR